MLRLGDHFDLLFYDQRGGGQSHADPREPVTWRTHVEDLGALIGEFALSRPTILGYSWGGLLAMLYAAQSLAGPPDLTPGRLALIDPAAAGREYRRAFEAEFERRGQSEYVQSARAALAASGLRDRDPAAYRQRAFELSVAGYFADPRRAQDLTPFRVVGRIQQMVWKSLDGFDLTSALERVREQLRIPTLVIHGREDPIPLASSISASDALGAELLIIDDCGHVPFVEAPTQLFAALEKFLAPLETPTTASRLSPLTYPSKGPALSAARPSGPT
jgi:proline iminopeptidase